MNNPTFTTKIEGKQIIVTLKLGGFVDNIAQFSYDLARRLIWYMYREAGMAYHDELIDPFSALIERRLTSVPADSPEIAAAEADSSTRRAAEHHRWLERART